MRLKRVKRLMVTVLSVVLCLSSMQVLAEESAQVAQGAEQAQLEAIAINVNEPTLLSEDTGVESFVTRLYEICLDRSPDEEGLYTWVSQLTSGQISGTEAAYGFLFSEEFKGKEPCAQSYVKCLYRCFMGREAEQEGLKFWMNYLVSGHTRGEAFNGFSQSVEFAGICEEYGITVGTADYSEVDYETSGRCQICFPPDSLRKNFVSRFYRVCLNREPDEAGLASWVECIKQGMTGVEVASGFVFSEEFKGMNLCDEHFVEYMYKAFFERRADEDGLATWVEILANGGTKGEVFNGFVQSREFALTCSSHDIPLGSADYSAVDFEPEEGCSVCPLPDYSTPWVYSEDGSSRTRTISDGTVVSEIKTVIDGQEVWGYYDDTYAEEMFQLIQNQRRLGTETGLADWEGNAVGVINVPELIYSEELKDLADYRAVANTLGFGSEGFEVVLAGGQTPQEALDNVYFFGNLSAMRAITNPDFIYGACSNFWYDAEGTGENLYPFWILEFDLYYMCYGNSETGEMRESPQYGHCWVVKGQVDGHDTFVCENPEAGYVCWLKLEWDSEAGAYVYVVPEKTPTLQEIIDNR